MGARNAPKRSGAQGGDAGAGEQDVVGLAREIHKIEPFENPTQEAFLNVMRTASLLSGPFERLFKKHGLSGATYNALRILRGSGDEGRRCSEVGEHLVAAVPDVTRLVDRLEEAGLAKRSRGGDDRRVVTVRITPAGLALLKKLDGPVLELHTAQLGHMNRKDLETLSQLLCVARERATDVDQVCPAE